MKPGEGQRECRTAKLSVSLDECQRSSRLLFGSRTDRSWAVCSPVAAAVHHCTSALLMKQKKKDIAQTPKVGRRGIDVVQKGVLVLVLHSQIKNRVLVSLANGHAATLSCR